jgi:hypothetical protein
MVATATRWSVLIVLGGTFIALQGFATGRYLWHYLLCSVHGKLPQQKEGAPCENEIGL